MKLVFSDDSNLEAAQEYYKMLGDTAMTKGYTLMHIFILFPKLKIYAGLTNTSTC